ncbi:MAG: aldehyde dehydrogenase family protein, partial [Acidobacteria bacterium]|nr:aldehyde dehydrogenase family protein [Acidobacteriota bacterium]
AFVEEMKKLKVGDPLDPSTDVGPIARKDLLEEVEGQVKESISQGARLILGGNRIEGKGYFYPPTVLDNVTPDMTCFKEEIFAPVAPIIKAKDNSDAVALANNSRFGLGASVWTMDIQEGERVASEIEAGTVFINGMVKSDPRLPFGGVKASGFGRELSYFGIREFVNIKSVIVE